jgi:hypothetical protein
MIQKRKVLALAAGLALFAGALSAYVLLNPRRTWSSPPHYTVDSRGMASVDAPSGGTSQVVAAITSNDAWNGAGAGEVITASSGSVAGFTLGDGNPMLNFEDPLDVCTGSCLAATFTGYYTQSGRGKSRTYTIVDADIVTNTAYDWTVVGENGGCSGQEFFLEGVQVHEAGHGLGLGHSNVTGATMYPSVSSCNNGPATIAADDIAGILDLYGDGGGGGCDLGQKGASCTADNQCCSGNCGNNGRCR